MLQAGFVATDQERRVRTRFQPALNAEADRIILITHRLARQFAERDAIGDLLFGHRLLAGQNRLDRRRCGRGRSRQYLADQEMPATNSGDLKIGEDAIDTTNIVAGIPLRFRNSWRRSEEHTSEIQSLLRTSYADFCLIK